jgi:hypothetical protein
LGLKLQAPNIKHNNDSAGKARDLMGRMIRSFLGRKINRHGLGGFFGGQYKKQRHKKDGQDGGAEHTAKHADADGLLAACACATAND